MPDPLWGQLILQLLLIAINAFFACTEIAVVSLNQKKIEKLAEDGDKKADKLLSLLRRPERFLSTIQVSITLAGFLGSAFAADNFAGKITVWLCDVKGFNALPREAVNTASILVVTLLLSYLTLVFGELVPKRIAMKKPEKVAMKVVKILTVAAALARPIVWLLSISTNGVLKLLHIDPVDKEEEVTEEEIRLMVDAGEENGNIEADEKVMIENIFEFNNTTATDIMVHRTEMVSVDVEASFDEVLALINESGYSRFPVYEGDIDNIIGILNARRFLINMCQPEAKTVRELVYEPYFAPESVRADMLFRDMQEKKSHIAVILDEYGGTAGIITMEDLLEQIVGNIYDETDEQSEEQEIVKLADNLYRMAGTVPLTLVEDELSIDFPPEEDEFTTLSGLIFSRFTAIPADGEQPELTIGRLHISVEEITEHRVVSALVELLPLDVEEGDESSESEES